MKILVRFSLLLMFFPVLGFADAFAYNLQKEITIQRNEYQLLHYHDWSVRFSEWKTSVFDESNKYSRLILKLANGKTVFDVPVPALTKLWISSDMKYMVGLSAIKYLNPYHLVIFDSSGKLLFKKSINCDSVTYPCFESVTNAVSWYSKEDTDIELIKVGKEHLKLSLNCDGGGISSTSQRVEFDVIPPLTWLNEENVATFDPAANTLHIPVIQVVGDESRKLYSAEMIKTGNETYDVTSIVELTSIPLVGCSQPRVTTNAQEVVQPKTSRFHSLELKAGMNREEVENKIATILNEPKTYSPYMNNLQGGVVEYRDEDWVLEVKYKAGMPAPWVVKPDGTMEHYPPTDETVLECKIEIIPKKAAEMIAPQVEPIGSEKLLTALHAKEDFRSHAETIRRGLVGTQMTYKAESAQWFIKHGTIEDVPYLIDALSDESMHVGANYPLAGMSTTRYWANVALIVICKVSYDYQWDSSEEKREYSISLWKQHWGRI